LDNGRLAGLVTANGSMYIRRWITAGRTGERYREPKTGAITNQGGTEVCDARISVRRGDTETESRGVGGRWCLLNDGKMDGSVGGGFAGKPDGVFGSGLARTSLGEFRMAGGRRAIRLADWRDGL